MEIQRKAWTERVVQALGQGNVVLYGQRGAGKRTLARQVMAKMEGEQWDGILCDLTGKYTRNTDEILNLVHKLANQLPEDCMEQREFDLVDEIYCKRTNQLPRGFFTHVNENPMTSGAKDAAEVLVDLLSLNIASNSVKAIKALWSIAEGAVDATQVKRLKGLNEIELREELKRPLVAKGEPQMLVVVQGLEEYSHRQREYLYTIPMANDKLRFLFLDEQPPTHMAEDLTYLALHDMGEDELGDYLSQRFSGDEALRDTMLGYFHEKQGLTPATVEGIAALVEQRHQAQQDISVEELRRDLASDETIWAEMSKKLSLDQQDVCTLLSLCDGVDMDCFFAYYPHLNLDYYIQWFSQPQFEQIQGRIALKDFYKKVAFPNGKSLLQYSYYRRMIRVWQGVLDEGLSAGCFTVEEVHRQLDTILQFCHHKEELTLPEGYQQSQGKRYMERRLLLEKYHPMVGEYWLEGLFLAEWKDLWHKCKGQDVYVYQQRILDTLLSRGRYSEAEQYLLPVKGEMPEGISGVRYVSLMKSGLEYHRIRSQQLGEAGVERADIQLCNTLLSSLPQMGISAEMEHALFIQLHTYLAKAMLSQKHNDQCKEHLDWVGTLSPQAVTLWKLYKYAAEYHMQCGEYYTETEELDIAEKNLKKSLEEYQYALVLEPHNQELILANGLAYKRLSEWHMKRGEVEPAVDTMSQALVCYRTILDQTPELIDSYQKIGFATSELGLFLWEHKRPEEGKDYCNQALEVGTKGVRYLERIGEDNRQVRNVMNQAHRHMAIICPEEAEEHLREAVYHGEKSIQSAPGNHLSYMEYLLSMKALLAVAPSATLAAQAASYARVLLDIDHSDGDTELANQFLTNNPPLPVP